MALRTIEKEGIDLGTLDISKFCYHLAKKGGTINHVAFMDQL